MTLSVPTEPSLNELARLAQQRLRPLVRAIDQEGYYPEPFLREYGEAGAFTFGVSPSEWLAKAIRITAGVGTSCGSTAFLLWCHQTCIWYLSMTENTALRSRLLHPLSTGSTLGATAFSNPMKHYAGLESLRLKADRVKGGYVATGKLPWVSNLGVGHLFGTVLDTGRERVAALIPVDGGQVRLGPSGKFSALEGTATYSVQLDRAFIPDENLLANPAEPFVNRIRPGFLLLQLGIAFGIIRGTLRDMERSNRTLDGINRFVQDQPGAIGEVLATLEATAHTLARAFSPAFDDDYLRSVLSLRLQTAELAHRAGFSALQHAGAPGFLLDSAPQRRMREALFFCLLTPSIKQLRKMLQADATPGLR